MSTNLPTHVRKVAAITRRDPANLREDIIQRAVQIASTAMDSTKAAEAATRVALAFDAARSAAKDPGKFDHCDDESKALCVADALITGLMPGGPNAEAWLIPRGSKLTFMPSHRGLCKLAIQAGYVVSAVPVHQNDIIDIEVGEVVRHVTDPRRYPTSLDHLLGVIVRVKHADSGSVLGDYWCPHDVIETRRTAKDFRGRKMTGLTWDKWPVEMAMKTAIRWAMARGLVPARSEGLMAALSAESRAPQPEPQRRTVPTFDDVRALPAPEPEEVAAEVLDAEAVRAAGGES